MKKLMISEMEEVLGGMSTVCKGLQALADTYARDGADDAAWEAWCDEYSKNGC